MEPKIGVVAICLMIILLENVVAQEPQPLPQPQPQPQQEPQAVANQPANPGGGGVLSQLAQNENVKAALDGLMKATNSSSPTDLLKNGLTAIIANVEESITKAGGLKSLTKDRMILQALDICGEVLRDSLESVQKSVDRMGEFDPAKMDEYVEDLKVWVGGVFSDQMVCMDGFEDMPGQFGRKMHIFLDGARKLTLNAFDLMANLGDLMGTAAQPKVPTGRRLLTDNNRMKSGMRRLMGVNVANTQPNVVVAKDGSGKYRTINEALVDVPKKGKDPFVIYVKAGVYAEQVSFEKHMTNVVLFGDGPTKTRVTGNLNYAAGVQTFKTATVAVKGDDFLCRDMGFENTAGPGGHQAVALRVQADKAIFLNCHMDGYQDTLYAQKFRQFYRDCTVTGTVDYIFGDAAAIFQNCNMIVRKPARGQNCMVTAHGKNAAPEKTGYVLQNCIITPEPALAAAASDFKIYLGRPWKEYAMTVYIQCQIDGIIDPAGWAEWPGTTNMDTCFYAEFGNRGAGAAIEKRVAWKGYRRLTAGMAQEYAASKFVLGDSWIPQTGVPYSPAL